MQSRKRTLQDETGDVWLISVDGGKIKLESKQPDPVADYGNRNSARARTLEAATMSMIAYFMQFGDTKEQAEEKVGQFSSETASYLYAYTLGNKKSLVDAINASLLLFMDSQTKAFLVNLL